MKFSHHNYEHYALDFLEGRLSPEDEGKFRDFLDLNPGLKQMLCSGMELSLQPERTIYPNKEFLKRTTTDLIQAIPKPDLDCISLLEKNVDQNISIENSLPSFKSSSRQKLFLLYKKTILKPGNEKFPEKINLKKFIPVRKQFYWWGSVAATLLLTLMIKVLFIPEHVQENLSENSEKIILIPAQNTGQEIPLSVNTVPEKIVITSNSSPVEELSSVSVENLLSTNYKTPSKLINTQTHSLIASQTEEVYYRLSPLSLRMSQSSLLEKQLKPPVIYIPRVLTQHNLLALENYTIEDFHVRLISSDTPVNPAGRKFISALRSTVELVSALSGGNMEINTSYNNNGRLTSFNLISENLKFSTNRKPD